MSVSDLSIVFSFAGHESSSSLDATTVMRLTLGLSWVTGVFWRHSLA